MAFGNSESSSSLSGGIDGFINYVPTTVDPGDTMLLGTVVFSVLLTFLLPCLVAAGKRLPCHTTAAAVVSSSEGNTTSDDDDDEEERTKNGKPAKCADGTSTVSTRRKRREDDDDDDLRSVHSTHTNVSSVVSGMVQAVLDATPHGGPLRNTQQFVVQKKHSSQQHHGRGNAKTHSTMMMESGAGGAAAASTNNDDTHTLDNDSILGRLSQDAVSIRDAVDGGAKPTTAVVAPTTAPPARSTTTITHWDRLMLVSEFDYESRRLCKLAVPFISQALLQGVMEAIRVAIIGRFISTNALLAYLAVDLLVGMTTSLLGGFQEALTTLCSQTLGQGNRRLAGQYVQIATVLFGVCFVPVFFLWMFAMGPAVTWLGFGDEVRRIAEEFTLFFLLAEFVVGIHTSAHSLLDVIGKENYSTLFYLAAEVASIAGLLGVALYTDRGDSLQLVGLVLIGMEALGLVVNTIIIVWNGWFDRFLGGMVGGFALLVCTVVLAFPDIPFCLPPPIRITSQTPYLHPLRLLLFHRIPELPEPSLVLQHRCRAENSWLTVNGKC